MVYSASGIVASGIVADWIIPEYQGFHWTNLDNIDIQFIDVVCYQEPRALQAGIGMEQ